MLQKIKSVFYYLFIYTFYKIIFKKLGSRSRIVAPLKIYGASNISIGSRVTVEYKTWLAAYPHTGASDCSLIIEDGAQIGNFNHIYATSKIHIGKKVLTADKVYISDNSHSYENVALAINDQGIKQLQEVYIGDGAWLGENVCVIGANVGKGSVVGANSVVTKNIPDFCIAVGAPARIIKRYNFDLKVWLKTTAEGEFIN